MHTHIKRILSRFELEGTYAGHRAFGRGHIHDTWKVETREKESPDYLLQRINTTVFKNVQVLQNNLFHIYNHLKDKIGKDPRIPTHRHLLIPVTGKEGEKCVTDMEGACWRMFHFISDHRSYDMVENTELAFQGGLAVGRFQALLADMDRALLQETIPDFHHVGCRIEQLQEAVETNYEKRAAHTRAEIDFALERSDKMQQIYRLGEAGEIPSRITHNDTKFNNILLDKDHKALCLIDLDTAMEGYVHYDFGDALRSGACTAAEDEADTSKIHFRRDIYQAYARGYLSEAREFLTAKELDTLAFSPLLMTYIMGIRFLADYLRGDTYYKTTCAEHNLIRTRSQFTLLSKLEDEFPYLQRVITDSL